MSLLSIQHVTKRFARGGRVALTDVSLEIYPAELVVVWGRRRSGRTTLLDIAAGMEPPTEGTVQFAGTDLAEQPAMGAHGGIGYCLTTFPPVVGDVVLDHVAAPLLGAGAKPGSAQTGAHAALRRVGAHACALVHPAELNHDETIRVAIARALVSDPRLLLLDEPTSGVPPADARDELLDLLRSLVDRERISILMTVDEAADFVGADRALSLDTGELRGQAVPFLSEVVPLRRRQSS